jgi:hypothetical protein
VNSGQLCVVLDPSDYQNALDQAKASLAQAEAQLHAENPNVPITETSNLTTISTSRADMASAEAAVIAAEQDYQASLRMSARVKTFFEFFLPLFSFFELLFPFLEHSTPFTRASGLIGSVNLCFHDHGSFRNLSVGFSPT